ncbi:hypothetical protein L210DRAFT_3612388 [Boletus edulis BED1]|uniref:Methyltransferase n=1 Tax=Boletus edulis BED1 TaxID=1328754 RepID=A0AAD4BVB5_BOLED|nr:hypothetical protein L210DRAFT_3612388 [Boletus edulis BED1]
MTSRDVHTTLNYTRPQDEPLYSYVCCEPPAGVPAHNVTNDLHSAVIHDVRGEQDAFGLDTSGFQWVNYPSAEKGFVDKKRIKTVYYAEVEDILKKHACAKRVFILDHTVRRNSDPETEPDRSINRGPAHFVHTDHTFSGVEQIVRRRFPDDAERLLKGRYQIINIWRPIANTVAHYPLGVLDFRSIDVDADLVPLRLMFPKCQGWMYNVKYNPGHKWYYLSDQTPDEVVLFKSFDSDASTARLVPHSAFPDKTSPADAPHRQSIGVRALVFDRE